ncbi:MAG: NAD-dependent epimerase/dehydratase family protein [bacterium]|nr:NAD-dependent epimerase/dehydratase family protein [bacterium]
MNQIIKEDCEQVLKRVDLSLLKNKSILLTGGTGFIGRYFVNLIYLINETKKLNCTLVATYLHKVPKDLKKLSGKKIKFLKLDLSKPFNIGVNQLRISGNQRSRRLDYIIHAAGYGQPAKFIQYPLRTIFINTNATEILLNLAKTCHAKFVFMSSADTYGDVPKNLKSVPETFSGNLNTLSPRAVYGESKRLGETICWAYRDQYGVDAKVVRASHLYGPGISIHDQRVLGNFLKGALVDKSIKLKDTGRAIKTFGYISDAIAMIMFIATKGKDMVYNIGGIDSLSIFDLAKNVARETNVKVIVPSVKARDKYIGSDPRTVRLDFSKIKKEMGKFSFTPFKTGLRRTINWNKEEFHL